MGSTPGAMMAVPKISAATVPPSQRTIQTIRGMRVSRASCAASDPEAVRREVSANSSTGRGPASELVKLFV